MIGKKIDIKQSAILAAVLGASVLVVNYLFSLLGTTVSEFFVAIPATSVITGTIGTKILGVISGLVPIGAFASMGYIALFISALVAVIVGEFVMDWLKLPVIKLPGVKANVQRLASVIIYGAIPVYLILVGTAVPGISAVIGVLIHTVVVAFIATMIAGILKLRI